MPFRIELKPQSHHITQEMFRNIYEESPIGIELYDSVGVLVDVNKACAEIFGLVDTEEVKGFKLFEDPNISDELKRRLQKGESINLEIPFDFEKVKALQLYRTSRSGTIHLNMLVTPLAVKGEMVTGGYLVQLQDISDRRKAAEDLREGEARFRALFEQNAVGVVEIETLTGRFIRVNQRFADIVGSTIEELQNTTFQSITHPDDLNPDLNNMSLLIEGKIRSFIMEKRYVRKDGATIWAKIAVSPLWAPGDKPTHNFAIVSDITQRKQAEEALNKSYGELAEVNRALEKEKHQIRITNVLLELFVQKISRKEYLDAVVKVIQEWSGYRCIGIRIADEDGNIPYEAYAGFTPEFLHTENYLSLKRDRCACIRVITGEFEPQDLPAKTPYGSFYSNNTLTFLSGLSEGDKTRYRRVCCVLNRFKSMAIIPIRYQEKVLGAIHMADEKEEMVTLKNVLFIETLAPIIGESIYRFNAEETLRESQERLRSLTAHLQEVRENERTIIAREIHDELGQIMTALKIDISWIKDKYQDHHDLYEKAKSMLLHIDATIQTVKKIITELRPGILDHLGISAAMEWQAAEFQKMTGIPCDIVIIPEEILLRKELTTNIFRIFQEILTNVMRHAGATYVNVVMEKSEEKVVLNVQDNGRGITAEEISNPSSFGLLGIRERVTYMDGTFSITGTPGKGTKLSITIPSGSYGNPDEEDDFYYFR